MLTPAGSIQTKIMLLENFCEKMYHFGEFPFFSVFRNLLHDFLPLGKEGYCNHNVCPSVRLSVCDQKACEHDNLFIFHPIFTKLRKNNDE